MSSRFDQVIKVTFCPSTVSQSSVSWFVLCLSVCLMSAACLFYQSISQSSVYQSVSSVIQVSIRFSLI